MPRSAARRSHLRAPAGALLVVALLAACSAAGGVSGEPQRTPTPWPAQAPGEAGPGATLRVAVDEPEALVPFEAIEPDDLLVVDALFDSLTRYAPNLVPAPAAATSWSRNDDATEWTFVLRPDATFHDGTPVTAQDFVYAWETAIRSGPAGFHLRDVQGYGDLVAGRAGGLQGLEALDDQTLRVRLNRPRGELPTVVAHPALGPVHRERWQDDPEAYREQPVGNGPFAAAEARVAGQYLRVRRAPEWRNSGAPAELDEIIFQFMDPETAFVAFQQGRLQVSPLPDGAVDAAVELVGESPDGYRGPGVLRGLTPSVYFLAFNVARPPFDDPDVRRAISLAINRAAVVEAVPADNVEPADAFIAPVLGGTHGSCEACRHDPEAAAALLAGRELGEITLWFNRDGGHRPVAEQVRADLTAVGVEDVRFETPPFGEYLDVLASGEAGFFRYGWRPEYPIADDLLTPLFHSREIGARNYMRYARDDVDALLDEARASTTSGRRGFQQRRAEDLIVNRDQAIVPIMWYRHGTVVAAEVEGFRLDPLGHANLHEVRLTAGES